MPTTPLAQRLLAAIATCPRTPRELSVDLDSTLLDVEQAVLELAGGGLAQELRMPAVNGRLVIATGQGLLAVAGD